MIGPAICELEHVPCTRIVVQSYTTSVVRSLDHIELEGKESIHEGMIP
jgi:hypothetical protein